MSKRNPSTQTDFQLRPQVGFTRLPNLLLDQVMPALGDTEWRLLVVIARQTLGRNGSGNRSGTDWLTHSQLKSRTGRASAAISRALDSLVSGGLVVAVADEGGRELVSAESRRAHHGRCRYGLSRELLQACGIQTAEAQAKTPTAQFSHSGIRKAKTTKESTYKRENTNKEANASEPSDRANTAQPIPTTERAFIAPTIAAVRIHSGWQRAGDVAARNARLPPKADPAGQS